MLFPNKRRIFSITVLLVLIGFISACNQNDQGGIRVYITDAPAYFDELNVEITKVMVNKNFDDRKVLEWEVIYEGSMQVNILDYQHGDMLELGKARIEDGLYRQVRIFFGTENSVVINGEMFELEQRWTTDDGFKLPIEADVSNGKMTDIYIDMDAFLSVVKLEERVYGLRPWLRTIHPAEQGSISGTVNPADSKSTIHVFDDFGMVINGQINSEGFFKISGLQDGTYEVSINPHNDSYADTLFTGIEIDGGSNYEFEEPITLQAE